MDKPEQFLPKISPSPVESDRDTATAGFLAALAWLVWVIAIIATASSPAIIIATWRALL